MNAELRGMRRIPKRLIANGFGHRLSIRIPLHCPQQPQKGTAGLLSGSRRLLPDANQVLLLSKRVHPARQAHQPLGPRETGRSPERGQALAVHRGRSQSPVARRVSMPAMLPTHMPPVPTGAGRVSLKGAVLSSAAGAAEMRFRPRRPNEQSSRKP